MANTCRGLALLLLAALGTSASRADTPPLDWKIAVNVTPMDAFNVPTSEDHIRLFVRGDQIGCTGLTFEPPAVSGTTIRLLGHRFTPPFECTVGSAFFQALELPPLPAGPNGLTTYTLEVYDEDLLIRSQPLDVKGPLKSLFFGLPSSGPRSAAFQVTVRLTDPRAGAPRDASAIPLTSQSGYFWFFDPDNVEVTVKILDGRPLNGHVWVFLTGMTNLAYAVTVTAEGCFPEVCTSKTFTSPAGRRLNVIDTTTF